MCIIEDHIAKHGVTKCAPALAAGNEMTKLSRRRVAEKRRAWSEETGVALSVGLVR